MEVPDIYIDGFHIGLSPYGVAITFNRTPGVIAPDAAGALPNPVPQALVRMSLECAKVLTMLLTKNLRRYELEGIGESISLPAPLMSALGLEGFQW